MGDHKFFRGNGGGISIRGGGGTRRIPQSLMGGSGKFLQNPPIPLFYPPPTPPPPAINEDRSMKVNLIGKIE